LYKNGISLVKVSYIFNPRFPTIQLTTTSTYNKIGTEQVIKNSKPILKVLHGELSDIIPIWLMRQAGRYLPEYRQLRAKAEHFLNMCLTPNYAVEITLQPIKRFDLDAAIVFADILLIPYALGCSLDFREGEGPVLQTVNDENDLARLKLNIDKVLPVFETLNRVRDKLPEKVALIGFCGAPWTVACYMIDGNSRDNFSLAKSWSKSRPHLLDRLIDILIEASQIYLEKQIESGAEIIQIFDSWSGLLEGEDFARWVIAPTYTLVKRLKAKYPHIPIIGFPREAGENYAAYVRQTGVDALSIDQHVDLAYAKSQLQIIKPLQGNLDPDLLVKGGDEMKSGLEKILSVFGPRHIVNLGHGVVPQTPPEHVVDLIKTVRAFKI
jgi:uroporphyrinogen decarboxylase